MKKHVIFLLAMVLFLSFSSYSQQDPDKTKLYQEYQMKIGNLRFKQNYLIFTEIKNWEIKTDTIKMYNDWDKPMKISFQDLPPYLKCKAIPEVLNPGKKGIILVTFDAPTRNEYGFVNYSLGIYTDDIDQGLKTVAISANIVEDFSKLTPKQRENAPKISFATTNYKFNNVKVGTIVKYSFEFTNSGKSDLIIRRTSASCGCTATAPEKSVLKPGESSKINIEFNTTGRMGQQTKSVTVISNDPEHPTTILIIEGVVTNE